MPALAAVLCIACAASGLLAQPGSSMPSDDALARYLDRAGLDGLLARHLRGVLDRTDDVDLRVALAERLGSIYADQFALARGPAERGTIRALAEDLLARVPQSDAFDLRLTIARAAYVHAEQIAERDRLRLTSPEERDEAIAVFATIDRDLESLGREADRRVQDLDTELRRPSSTDTVVKLRELMSEARRRRSLAMYYAGWSAYYRGMLTGRTELARRAERLLGYVLNAGGETPTLDRLPESLMRYEHVARAAMGVALCRSLAEDHVDAALWLDAVAADADVAPSVAAQMLARQIVVLGRAERWDKLIREIAKLADQTDQAPAISVSDARLLAVAVLESSRTADDDPDRKALLELALGSLVRSGEIGHVLDLVDRFGTLPLGSDGFITQYVRGMSSYNAVRTAHAAIGDDTVPANDAGLRNGYLLAENALEGAFVATDAGTFDERGQAAMLRGLATYYRGEPAAASAWLESVFDSIPEARRSESLWLAVAFLDEAGSAADERSAELAGRFVSLYPSDPRAASLLLRAVGARDIDDEQAIEILTGVPVESPLYGPARRQASQLLYKSFRKAPPSERDDIAAAFLAEASALLDFEQRARQRGETLAADRALGLTRQMLDVCLAVRPPRIDIAARLVDHAAAMLSGSMVVGADAIESELQYRRVQIALAQDQRAAADEIAEQLAMTPGPFADLAQRTIFADAATRWEASPTDAARAYRVVMLGTRLVAAMRDDASLTLDRRAAAIAETAARAAAVLAVREDDVEMRDIALRLDREQLDAGSPTAASLKRYASLNESAGDPVESARAWRFLSSALSPPDPAWFEARCGLMRALEQTDPEAARRVFDQHRVLYPDLGPAPWNACIASIGQELDAERQRDAP